MARYEHLPIYKQSLDAATHFEKVVAGFSRYHKYTLGTELRDKSREAVALVVRANSAEDKRAVLLELRQCLEELLIAVRLANSWRLWRSIWREFSFLAEYFGFDAAAWKLIRHYADVPRFSTVRDQYAGFCRRYPDHVVFLQVGGFVEFYGDAGRAAGERLGLRPMRANRRQAMCGFRLRDEAKYLARARFSDRPVLVVRERDDRCGRIKTRETFCRYAWNDESGSSIAA